MHEFLVPLFTSLCEKKGPVFLTVKGVPYMRNDGTARQIISAVLAARKRLRKAGTPIDNISAYTARHTVSTQLVVNGVHPHIKDQILGHAVDDMSRRYTSVPRQPLIDAINTLPVPEGWRELEWWDEPIRHTRKLRKWGKAKK